MFMLTIFETKKAKEEKSHLRNLITLAHADGELSKAEIDAIYKIGECRGLRKEDIAVLFSGDSLQEEILVPDNDTERFNQIYDLTLVMLSDGQVVDSEMDFCIEIAQGLGFSKAFAGVVVNKIAMGISNQLDKDAIKRELESFLVF